MEVVDIISHVVKALLLVLWLSLPPIIVASVVGTLFSLFQALTQIQEMTLVFVPKILAIFIAMLVALPFMADTLQGHMTRIALRIAGG